MRQNTKRRVNAILIYVAPPTAFSRIRPGNTGADGNTKTAKASCKSGKPGLAAFAETLSYLVYISTQRYGFILIYPKVIAKKMADKKG